MNYLENNPIKEFVKGEIIEKLKNLKGCEEQYHMRGLSYMLFGLESHKGGYFYNNYEAKKWISKNFEYIEEIAKKIRFKFDPDYANKILFDIFDNPDRFIVSMIVEVASYLMSRCNTAEKYWNDEITLTDELIDKLISEVKKV